MSERSDLIKVLRLALTANEQAESLERLSASYRVKAEQLEPWLLQTLAAYDDVCADLDDMQAEWAYTNRELEGLQRKLESKRILLTSLEKELESARGYAASLEQQDRQSVIRADEQAEEIARLERELAASQTAHAATCEAWRNDKDFRAHTAPKAPSVPRRATPGMEVEV